MKVYSRGPQIPVSKLSHGHQLNRSVRRPWLAENTKGSQSDLARFQVDALASISISFESVIYKP